MNSFAHLADWCILLSRSDPESTRHAGLTYLIVDMHAPGVEVRPLMQITGEAEFNEIFFTGVRVPAENLLGEIGGGWQVAMTTLLHERGTLGFALQAALELLGPDAQLLAPNAPYGGYWTTQQLRSRGNTIEAGTSEILRNILAERVLGLPRSR